MNLAEWLARRAKLSPESPVALRATSRVRHRRQETAASPRGLRHHTAPSPKIIALQSRGRASNAACAMEAAPRN